MIHRIHELFYDFVLFFVDMKYLRSWTIVQNALSECSIDLVLQSACVVINSCLSCHSVSFSSEGDVESLLFTDKRDRCAGSEWDSLFAFLGCEVAVDALSVGSRPSVGHHPVREYSVPLPASFFHGIGFPPMQFPFYFSFCNLVFVCFGSSISKWSSQWTSINRGESFSPIRHYRKQAVDFDICKRNLILKLRKELDKSKKGSVDEPIVDLVNYINKTKDFCTTSSCSGRFSVFCAEYDEAKGEQVSVGRGMNSNLVEGREVAVCGAPSRHAHGVDGCDSAGTPLLQGSHTL